MTTPRSSPARAEFIRIPVSVDEAFASSEFDGDVCVSCAAPTHDVPHEPIVLSPEARALVDERLRALAGVGRATRAMLCRPLELAASWAQCHHEPAKGNFRRFATLILTLAIEREYEKSKLTREKLKRELEDERFRDDARVNDSAEGRFLVRWDRWVERRQRHYGRWRDLPRFSDDEFRWFVQDKLIVAVHDGSLERYARPGCEATFRFVDGLRRAERKRGRLYVVSASGIQGNNPTVHTLPMSPEELLLAAEEKLLGGERSREVQHAIQAALATPEQREWFRRFRDDFAEHGELNPAHVATKHGVNRSSTSRMLATIAGLLDAAGIKAIMRRPLGE